MRIRSIDGDSASPASRENISMIPYTDDMDENYNSQPTLERSGNTATSMQLSSPTDTVNTVIRNPEDRTSSGSLTRRSVGNFEPLIRPDEPLSPPPADIHDDEIHPDKNSESQRLMGHSAMIENTDGGHRPKPGKRIKRAPSRADSYSPGTCCFCLSNMTCTNIFLWISLVIALIVWSVSIWRSIDSMELISKIQIRTGYGVDGFPFTDITIILIASATFLFSIVFIVVSSYTSQSLSSYHLPSSQLNKCAYCFTIAMAVLSCVAVILWTLIIAATMIPTTAVAIIHLLFKSGTLECVHLPSYGIGEVKVGDNGISLHCGDELEDWLKSSWEMMTPLLISLGCALLIEIVLMGFIIVVSSNGRHLRERMEYLMSSKIVHGDSSKEQAQPFI